MHHPLLSVSNPARLQIPDVVITVLTDSQLAPNSWLWSSLDKSSGIFIFISAINLATVYMACFTCVSIEAFKDPYFRPFEAVIDFNPKFRPMSIVSLHNEFTNSFKLLLYFWQRMHSRYDNWDSSTVDGP